MLDINKLLQDLIKEKNSQINEWLETEYQKLNPCFYSSVDIRNSGSKLAPVDTNLFPAGFNNFYPENLAYASSLIKDFLKKNFKDAKKILIYPEKHTRNLFYLENLANIANIIAQAGYEIKICLEELDEEIALNNNYSITNFSLDLNPDLIILNNDLSNGIAKILKKQKVPIIPALELGWHKRKKTNHFNKYNQIVEKFCQEFNLNPFFITTEFTEFSNANFKDSTNLLKLAEIVDQTIDKIQKAYQLHNIKDDPYVFIKANQGTYGMGIMTAKSGGDITAMNKKTKNKMLTVKGGIKNTNVIIQEGIKTIDIIDNFVTEPLIYLVDSKPIGITYRMHEARDEFKNLNVNGVVFKKILSTENHAHLFLIARLATIASCME